jgi:hypothetical protein
VPGRSLPRPPGWRGVRHAHPAFDRRATYRSKRCPCATPGRSRKVHPPPSSRRSHGSNHPMTAVVLDFIQSTLGHPPRRRGVCAFVKGSELVASCAGGYPTLSLLSAGSVESVAPDTFLSLIRSLEDRIDQQLKSVATLRLRLTPFSCVPCFLVWSLHMLRPHARPLSLPPLVHPSELPPSICRRATRVAQQTRSCAPYWRTEFVSTCTPAARAQAPRDEGTCFRHKGTCLRHKGTCLRHNGHR